MEKYYSQYNQDKILDEEVFNKKPNGVFIDVGAGDGISISNSYFFEKYRGWSGICIEPRKSAYGKLINNRKCVCYNNCIDIETLNRTFIEIEGYSELLSGIKEYFTPKHLKRIESESKKHKQSITEYLITCCSLQYILDKALITLVDFCSIDTEGSELSVLQSIDFDRVKIDIFIIENRYNRSIIDSFLVKKNYFLLFQCKSDGIYRKALHE